MDSAAQTHARRDWSNYMSQHSAIVRTARPADAGRLGTLEVRSWQYAYRDIFPAGELEKMSPRRRMIRWARRLDGANPAEISLVAEGDDGVVGYLQCGPSRGGRASAGEIYSVYVDPLHWGCGVGTGLMEVAFDWMAPRFESTLLWVVRENERARSFYESRGFVEDHGSVKTFTFFNYAVLCVRYSTPLQARPSYDWRAHFSA